MAWSGIRTLVVGACLFAGLSGVAETLVWDRTPVRIVLHVGHEQQVSFPGAVSVGAPGDVVESGSLRTQIVGDTVYWEAWAAFDRRRVKVRMLDSGEFVLIDLVAVEGSVAGDRTEPVRVVLAGRGTEGSAPPGTGVVGVEQGLEVRDGLVELVRYAAQVDHAPPRLVEGVSGVSEVETRLREVTGLYRHPDAEKLKLVVRGQWGAYGLFVLAVDAVNEGTDAVEVDVRRIAHSSSDGRNGVSGGLVAAASVGGWAVLEPRGQAGSVKRLYLVTRRPADIALAVD